MRKSHMRKDFGAVPTVNKPRSTFNHNHSVATAIDGGFMYPIMVKEILPGDTWNVQCHISGRFATPIFPIMDNIKVTFMTFFVPNRLVWDNWERFMGQQDDPDDSIDFLIPTKDTGATGIAEDSLQDFMGLPKMWRDRDYNVLPFRMHHLIFNTWIKDQNLIDNLPVPKDDGPDDAVTYDLFRRAKRPDYFTTCLPFLQKGDPIEFSLAASAPVTGTLDDDTVTVTGSGDPTFDVGSDSNITLGRQGGVQLAEWSTGTGADASATWNAPALAAVLVDDAITGTADLTAATSITVNELRLSVQTQELLENDARTGTRYIEKVFGEFGVRSPDARHQRPELLAIYTKDLQITPVPQTSETSAQAPQGNLAAYGTATGAMGSFVKSFTEHGYVLTYAHIHADLTYQQGVEKMWTRSGRYDFYTPILANLGEQAVANKEIVAVGSLGGPDLDDLPFGYQERWAEYRSSLSRLTGPMRSSHSLTLDAWHCAQEFSATPVLGETFIEDNPPFDRNIEVTTEPHFLLNAFFTANVTRVMPTYSIPSITSMKL